MLCCILVLELMMMLVWLFLSSVSGLVWKFDIRFIFIFG